MLPLVLIPPASHVWSVAHVMSEGVSESITRGFRRIRWDPRGTGSGASQVGIRASGWRYPTSPACRITLPTVVEFRAFKLFSKIRWIDLISSDFSSYLHSFSSYLCEFWVFSLIWVFPSLRFRRGLDDLCPHLLGPIFGGPDESASSTAEQRLLVRLVNTRIFKSRCLLCHTSQSQEYCFCET